MRGRCSALALVYNRLVGAAHQSTHEHEKYVALTGPALGGHTLSRGDVLDLVQHGRVAATFEYGSAGHPQR